MLSGMWANNSATGFSTYGTAKYGQIQFVPNVAEDSLLVIFGGETSNDVKWYDNGSNLLSFDTIHTIPPPIPSTTKRARALSQSHEIASASSASKAITAHSRSS